MTARDEPRPTEQQVIGILRSTGNHALADEMERGQERHKRTTGEMSHLRALVRECRPDASFDGLRGVERTAIETGRLPAASVLRNIARSLGCDPERVIEACARDLGFPFGESRDV